VHQKVKRGRLGIYNIVVPESSIWRINSSEHLSAGLVHMVAPPFGIYQPFVEHVATEFIPYRIVLGEGGDAVKL
jgi:hypothetical protein